MCSLKAKPLIDADTLIGLHGMVVTVREPEA